MPPVICILKLFSSLNKVLDELECIGVRQKGDTGSEHVSSRAQGFRARPLNRKVCTSVTAFYNVFFCFLFYFIYLSFVGHLQIFEAPSLLHKKRSTPQLPDFQVSS